MKRADLIRLVILLMLISSLSSAQDLFDQGVQAFRRSDDDRALELLKQAVALNPKRADPHAYLGATYLAISSRSAAISAMLKNPQASASMPEAERLAAAKAITSIPETERLADVELRRALELDPNNEVALESLVTLARDGHADLPEAERAQKRAEAKLLYDRLTLAFADSSLRQLAEVQLAPNPASDSTGGLYSSAAEIIESNWHQVMERANASPLDPTGPLRNPMRQALRTKYAAVLNEALGDYQQALHFNPNNSSAMIGMSILIRDQAVLRDTQAEYDADVATATQWMHRGVETRQAQSRPAAAAPAQVRASDSTGGPRLIRKVTPNYPPSAGRGQVSETVRFAITIAGDGRATNLRVLNGNPIFVEAAEDALKQWRWLPTMVNGNIVEVETEVEVRFSNN